jgi:TusA-related sulfurtransferase
MKTYEAIAKTKSGEEVSIVTTEANSIEEARSALSRFLWATNCEDAEIREIR